MVCLRIFGYWKMLLRTMKVYNLQKWESSHLPIQCSGKMSMTDKVLHIILTIVYPQNVQKPFFSL